MKKALAFLALSALPAYADTAVKIGSGYALMNGGKSPSAVVILLSGGNGQLGIMEDGSFSSGKGNQLVRTRKTYASQGLVSLTLDSNVSVSAAITYARETYKKPVIVVATSRGSLKIPGSLSAQPNGIVITAGFLESVQSSIGSAAALPPTLVVHHKLDGCSYTPFSAVAAFKAWGGAKVRVSEFNGGDNEGDPCQPWSYHGFAGQDRKVVGVVASFAKSVR